MAETTWVTQLGLWLARKGGWTLPEPRTIVLPDPAVTAERDEMSARIKELLGILHIKDTKLQLRDAKIQQIEAQVQGLEYDLATASNTITAEQSRHYAETLAQLHAKIEEQQALLTANLGDLSVAPEILLRARELTAVPRPDGMGGEAKRHAVYARLIKDFPDTNKRALGLAIEMVLRAG